MIQQFQGTSQKGDFQSALRQAIGNALEALSFIDGGVISDQRIRWKIIETSGISGGFAGDDVITVTIEAKADFIP
jgi:hypothetical protein